MCNWSAWREETSECSAVSGTSLLQPSPQSLGPSEKKWIDMRARGGR